MARGILYIDNVAIPLTVNVPIPSTYKIKDVRNPGQTDSDITRTIEIPGTLAINKIFEAAFEVNISFQNFNPNLKKPVRFEVDSRRTLIGNIQLNRIKVNYRTQEVTYVCNIKGQLTDLFYEIGEKYLTGNDNPANDLNFSIYDHNLTRTNVFNTWDPIVIPNTNKVSGVDTAVVAGIGYRYPLIDYGYNGGNVKDYYVHHQRPGLFLYEYLKKIFAAAGKTWSSAILESSLVKSLMIPCTELLETNSNQIDLRQFFVGAIGVSPDNQPMGYGGTDWNSFVLDSYVKFNTNSPSPYNDTGSQYNTSTGQLVVGVAQTYTITARCSVLITINPPTPTDYVGGWNMSVEVSIEQFFLGTWTSVATSGTVTQYVPPGTDNFVLQVDESYSALIEPASPFRINVRTSVTNLFLYASLGGPPIVVGSVSYDTVLTDDDATVGSNSNLTLMLNSKAIYQGDTININSTIPKKIKQKDLLKAVINAFNLYILPDKENINNYFIEPREPSAWSPGFYSGFYKDWTHKLDIGPDVEIVPMGELEIKRFKFRYKDDADYYNKIYQEAWGESYGQKIFEAENQFVTEEQVQELVFSATPLVGNNENGLVIPKIYKSEGGVITPIRGNIRLLQWGNHISIRAGYWRLYQVDGTFTALTDYPYAGPLDNPYAPTFDLSFARPVQFYYNFGAGPFMYTADNFYSVFIAPYIEMITNKNSKLLQCFLNLNEIDISELDFRDQVRVKDAYYYVNSIIDFDNLEPKPTKTELLKLLL